MRASGGGIGGSIEGDMASESVVHGHEARAAGASSREAWGRLAALGALIDDGSADEAVRQAFAETCRAVGLEALAPAAFGERVSGVNRRIVERRLMSNLNALSARLSAEAGAALAKGAREWLDRHTVVRDRGGRLWCFDLASSICPVEGFCDHRGLGEAFTPPHVSDRTTATPRPYTFVGLTPADLLLRVHESTGDVLNGYSPCLFVVAESDASIFPALATAELQSVLSDPRVHLFAGGCAIEEMIAFLAAHPDIGLPRYLVVSRPAEGAFADRVGAAINEADRARSSAALALRAEALGVYESLSAERWTARYEEALRPGTERPLRVMIPVSRFSTYLKHSARQLAEALRRRGCEVEVVSERSDHELVAPERYFELYRLWRPDLVIKIDHLRAESEHLIPTNVPYVCWVQDRLPDLFCPEAGPRVTAMEVVAGLGVRQLVERYGYPAAQCLPSLNVTDLSVYRDEAMKEEALAPHRCDVAYVSNHSEPPEAFAETLIARHVSGERSTAYARWVARRVRAAFEKPGEPTCRLGFETLLIDRRHGRHETFDEAGLRRLYDFFCLPLADRWYRHEMVQWAIAYCERRSRRLRLYGRGWERHEATAAYACGEVRNGEELRAVYQAAGVNLHASIFGSLHQRVLDGYASGGLVLCRRPVCDRDYLIYTTAEAEAARLGRRRFTLGEADRLRTLLDELFCGEGQTHPAEAEWDLDSPRFGQWREPRPPLIYRSFDELAPEAEAVSFHDSPSLEARLEALLGNEGERRRLIGSMRERIAADLTTDALAGEMIAAVRRVLGVSGVISRKEAA